MKTKLGVLVGVGVFAIVLGANAIENLQISVVGSNAILSWPSVANESFIVQYRATLATNDSWVSLASNVPGKIGTKPNGFRSL